MAIDRQRQIGMGHAAAVVGDADPAPAAAIGEDVDPARAGVDRILHQFLDHARRTFDHFAGGDAVDDLFGQLADGHGLSATRTEWRVNLGAFAVRREGDSSQTREFRHLSPLFTWTSAAAYKDESVAKVSRNCPEIPARRPHGAASMVSAPFVTRLVCAMAVRYRRTAHDTAEPLIAKQHLGELNEVSENLSDRVCHLGPACRPRIGARRLFRHPDPWRRAGQDQQYAGRGAGSVDQDMDARRAARKQGRRNAKSGTKGTVGAGSGAAPKGSGGAMGDPAAGEQALIERIQAKQRELRSRGGRSFFNAVPSRSVV